MMWSSTSPSSTRRTRLPGRRPRFAFALTDDNLAARKRLFLTATPRHYNLRSAKGRRRAARLFHGCPRHTVPALHPHVRRSRPARHHLRLPGHHLRGHFRHGHRRAAPAAKSSCKAMPSRRARSPTRSPCKAVERVGTGRSSPSTRPCEPAAFTSADGEGIGTHLPEFQTFHVNGTMPTAERDGIMREFRGAARAVISNARCLTEGVDVPAVDMVAFLTPKRSRVDIVQATGRAMRKRASPERPPATCSSRSSSNRQEAKPSSKRSPAPSSMKSGTSSKPCRSRTKCWPTSSGRCARRRGGPAASMMHGFGRRCRFSARRCRWPCCARALRPGASSGWPRPGSTFSGSCLLSCNDSDTLTYPHAWPEDPHLAAWVASQAPAQKPGPPLSQTASGDSTNLASSGPHGSPRGTRCSARWSSSRSGRATAMCRPICPMINHSPNWVTRQRQLQKQGRLAADRIQRLDALGFEWGSPNAPIASWDEMYTRLARYKKQAGDCNVPDKWEEYPQLATWIRNQRGRRTRGSLSADHIQRLEALGGVGPTRHLVGGDVHTPRPIQETDWPLYASSPVGGRFTTQLLGGQTTEGQGARAHLR